MSHMTVDLSERDKAVLASQAKAAHMAPDRYLSEIVSRALERQRNRVAADLAGHLDAMAGKSEAEVASEDMEAALEEALAAVRPRRIWKP